MIKVIVLDLDHTIGHFFIVSLIWNFMIKVKCNLNQVDFNIICSIFPNVIRYNILSLFSYLSIRQRLNNHIKILIYTHNKNGIKWIKMITNYIEYKLNCKLFCNIIENTSIKSYNDFILKSGVPKTAKILFIDDSYHSNMEHDKVIYLNIKKYSYFEKNNVIINNFITSDYFNKKIPSNVKEKVIDLFKNYLIHNNVEKIKSLDEKKIDKIVLKMILGYVQKFLNEPINNTRKNRKKLFIYG